MFPAGGDSPPGMRPAYRTLRIGRGGAPQAAIRSRDAPGKTGRHPVPPCPLP